MKKYGVHYKTWSVAVFAIISCIPVIAFSQNNATATKRPTIVLVHGAFADGSSWNKVIPILQKNGFEVKAVQNPLTSLADDVTFTERAIAEADGPVILVGHSWGGVVITQAGNKEKVKALVYVAAYALDEGQSVDSLSREAYEIRKIPNMRALMEPVVVDGFIHLKEEVVLHHFAQDLPEHEAKLVAAVQGRLHAGALTTKVSVAAWQYRPSYYVVAGNDHIISPVLEAEMAAKIKAKTYHLPASHVAMLAKPAAVAEIIISAAEENK